MNVRHALLGGSLLALGTGLVPAFAAEPARTAPSVTAVAEIVVTAQKREENIQSVPMSVSATTGRDLLKLGVNNVSELQNVVVGFTSVDYAGTKPTYTIRGVGFQDGFTLASSPTVSVYLDQVPQTISLFTRGDTLDLQRVEVLKGPQGTLFGENATGGAVNFIPNGPTETFTAGADVSYGNFNTADIRGFFGGPISETLDFRIALQTVQGGDWQYSYTHPAHNGAKNFDNGRVMLLWRPSSKFRALLTLSGFIDRSDTQAAQDNVSGPHPGPIPPVNPGLLNYPIPPSNDRAADWNNCIPTNFRSDLVSTNCSTLAQDNKYYQVSLRMDYDLTGDVVLTSLSSYEHYARFTPYDLDGTTFTDYAAIFGGSIDSTFQEIRAAGRFGKRGNWIVGANYQDDSSSENIYQNFTNSDSNIGGLTPDTIIRTKQDAATYAVYGNIDYPITDTIALQGGIRYTKQNRTFSGCLADAGDGKFAAFSQMLQNSLQGVGFVPGPPGINPGPFGCTSISDTFPPVPEMAHRVLNEDNVSWRVGATWKPAPKVMVYFNASRGYKSGGFPTLPAVSADEFQPAVQEALLAYELGFKTNILDNRLQLDGAIFYYDYTNKQITGTENVPFFGPLPVLVNIPKSRVEGFELSATWQPIRGLTISPSVSDANSSIKGHFITPDALGDPIDVIGQPFPYAPQWQARLDLEYDWRVGEDINAYIGASASYTGKTYDGFGNIEQTKVPARTLLDLRAGLERGAWRVEIWGKNVTNLYYWTQASDSPNTFTFTRLTGMPSTYGVTLSYRYH